MKLLELIYGTVTLLEVAPAEQPAFDLAPAPGAACTLQQSASSGEVLLSLEQEVKGKPSSRVWKVKPAHKKAESHFDAVLGRGFHQIALVVAAVFSPAGGGKKGATAQTSLPTSLAVRVHEFTGFYAFPDRLEVGLDDKIKKQLHKDYLKNYASIEQLERYLLDELTLPSAQPGGLPRVVISASPNEDLAGQRGFRLLGKTLIIDLARNAQDKLIVQRITHARRPKGRESRPLMLAEVDLHFTDISMAGIFKGVTRTTLEQLAEKDESYLNLWKKYNDLERRSLVHQVCQFGWIPYVRSYPSPNGSRVFELETSGTGMHTHAKVLERIRQAQDDRLSLQAVKTVPEAIERRQQSLLIVAPKALNPRTLQASADEQEIPTLKNVAPSEGKDKAFVGTYEAHREEGSRIKLELAAADQEDESTPPAKGHLIVSPLGDRVRLERREAAEAAIRTAINPMPQLGMVLEQQPVPSSRHKHLKAMSPTAKKRFRGESTPAQKKALDIALNTPDIALIQGPPGTGKTQVISALEILLAEHNEQSELLSGSILLSSFQHDAVENAVERTEVLGLPAVKVGGRQGEAKDLDISRTWRKKQVERMQERLAAPTEANAYVRLRAQARDLAVLYRQNPGGSERWIPTLEQLHRELAGFLPPELSERFLEILLSLNPRAQRRSVTSDDSARTLQLKAVRGLRVTEAAFRDDGPTSALKVLKRLENQLDPDSRALLEQASAWESDQPLEFLKFLETLQNSLLDSLTPVAGPPVVTASHPDIEALLAEVVETLCQHELSHQTGIEATLLTYLEDLEQDPLGVTDTLREYTAVLAATCQQAAGRKMKGAKGIDGAKSTLAFDSVIIDEAARANPLDLLIPMAQARRRIVLVGDQRQLPHMLEPDLERELELSASEQVMRQLKLSLFQRLYDQLEERQKADGICRTVMLDTQFRMHPDLGDFISQHFYEGRLKSGRPASDFGHHLPGYQGCMAWLSVPMSKGPEQRGQSKARPVEAETIVKELKRLLDHCDQSPDPTQRNLTFGVITFYSAQVEALWDALHHHGLSELSEGRDSIKRPYARFANGRERLRIGTVDAFQGKEFDVVFLSMTRANHLPELTEEDKRRRFGHLMLSNRLNVAMSRQQRLLIVAGAPELVTSSGAKQAIPALADFHKRCADLARASKGVSHA